MCRNYAGNSPGWDESGDDSDWDVEACETADRITVTNSPVHDVSDGESVFSEDEDILDTWPVER